MGLLGGPNWCQPWARRLLACLQPGFLASAAAAGGFAVSPAAAATSAAEFPCRSFSTQPGEGSFKAQTRALLKLIHPDLFHKHPAAKVG